MEKFGVRSENYGPIPIDGHTICTDRKCTNNFTGGRH